MYIQHKIWSMRHRVFFPLYNSLKPLTHSWKFQRNKTALLCQLIEESSFATGIDLGLSPRFPDSVNVSKTEITLLISDVALTSEKKKLKEGKSNWNETC